MRSEELAAADNFELHMRRAGVAPEDISVLLESYFRADDLIAVGHLKPQELQQFVLRDAKARGMGPDIIQAASGWANHFGSTGNLPPPPMLSAQDRGRAWQDRNEIEQVMRDDYRRYESDKSMQARYRAS